jgi:hypothetical protein
MPSEDQRTRKNGTGEAAKPVVGSPLGAVKRAVDDETGAGRFLLTGSVHADLDTQSWPGTGRLVRLQMYGLTVREMIGRSAGQPFLQRLACADMDALPPAADPPDLLGYVELALIRAGSPKRLCSSLASVGARGWRATLTSF